MKVAIWVVTFGNDDLLVPADRRGTRDAQLAHTEDQGRAVQTKPDGSAFRAANNPFGLANP